MATAEARGWGSGWPDCQRDRCVWITAGGIRLLVRVEVAPIFKGFCDELVQRGYPLGNVADDWGFACRAVRGTDDVPSNHSWGLAIDLNATTNPMGSTLRTDFPAWAVELGEKKYGLRWGGRYASRPDAMHWEWMGTPAEAEWLVAALAALPSDQQPPEPAPQEAPMQLIFSGDVAGQVWLVDGLEMEPVNSTAQMQYYQGNGVAGPVSINADHWRLLKARWDRTLAQVDASALASAIAAQLPTSGATPSAEEIAEAVRQRLVGALSS